MRRATLAVLLAFAVAIPGACASVGSGDSQLEGGPSPTAYDSGDAPPSPAGRAATPGPRGKSDGRPGNAGW